VATVTTAPSERSAGSFLDRRKPEHAMSFSTMMVHVDVEHDSEQRVELAIGLADVFRRRHARAFISKPDLLPVVSLTFAP
jgi:hypothetical protein